MQMRKGNREKGYSDGRDNTNDRTVDVRTHHASCKILEVSVNTRTFT